MKQCKKCGRNVPTQIMLQGKRRNLRNRTQCLKCLPFGKSPYRKKSVGEKRSANTAKVLRWMAKRKAELGVDPISLVRKDRKKQVVDALGGCCSLCKYGRCVSNLVFHHLWGKEFTLDERSFQYSWPKLLPELLKCVLLCHNCHGETHAGLIDPDLLVSINILAKEILKGFMPTRMSLARAKLVAQVQA